jgi:predicted Rossmann fold flavoprotein
VSNGEAPPADVFIVGGGAAGLAVAIQAASLRPAWRIVLAGGAPRLGAKLLLSGGGRCNLTHAVVDETDFNGGPPHLVRRVLKAVPVARTLEWFRELGIRTTEEPDGRVFPLSGGARAVRETLAAAVAQRGVQIEAGLRVGAIEREERGFVLRSTQGGAWRARRVVLATGGRSYPQTGSDGSGYGLVGRLGHSIVPTIPALVPLALENPWSPSLSGVSHPAELCVTREGRRLWRGTGALLWTHFGMSGPLVLDASRHILRARQEGAAVGVSVCFSCGRDVGVVERELLAIARAHPKTTLLAVLAGRWPRAVATAVLAALALTPERALSQLNREDRRRVVAALVDWPLTVTGHRGYDVAEVTAGGVPLGEVDCATLASRRCPGLFLAGELLDVDGRMGGFNLQWAWSSALVAARGVTAQ